MAAPGGISIDEGEDARGGIAGGVLMTPSSKEGSFSIHDPGFWAKKCLSANVFMA